MPLSRSHLMLESSSRVRSRSSGSRSGASRWISGDAAAFLFDVTAVLELYLVGSAMAFFFFLSGVVVADSAAVAGMASTSIAAVALAALLMTGEVGESAAVAGKNAAVAAAVEPLLSITEGVGRSAGEAGITAASAAADVPTSCAAAADEDG